MNQKQPPHTSSSASASAEALCPRSDADIPPDGDELVYEWREGPHKLVERRKGAGDDVEVEIVKNFYGPGSMDRCLKVLAGASGSVRRALRGEHVEGVRTVAARKLPASSTHTQPETKP